MQATTYTAADCTAPAMTDKAKIIALLYSWVSQRPGLDPRDYGGGRDGWTAYRSESRSITRDLHEARTMLAYVERHDGITAERLRDAFSAFSGRLSLTTTDKGMRLDYCTGQYWPTEYRRAVCAVLASAIWGWLRDECMPAPSDYRAESFGKWSGAQFTHDYGKRWASRECAEQELQDLGGAAWGSVVERYAGKSAGDFLRRAARRELGASITRRWFH